MTNYLIRRSFQMVAVVIAATIAIFLLLNATPGGPLSGLNLAADQRDRLTDEEIALREAAFGLNKPIYLAYLTWLTGEAWVDEVGDSLGNPNLGDKLSENGTWVEFQTPTCQAAGGSNTVAIAEGKTRYPCSTGIIRGDFGKSWRIATGVPVSEVIGSRVANTVRLTAFASLFSLILAIPIGIISAVRQYSILDYFVTTFSFFGISMPAFWFGLILVIVFGVQFQRWGLPAFPTGDAYTLRVVEGTMADVLGITSQSVADYALHLVLPTLMLSLLSLAGWSRFMRSSMLEVLRQDYVRTARAKGLRERVVIMKHATRNALIPLITIVVFQIPGIFGGAILTETIFNYPGMGRLFIDALNRDDWPVVMAYLFISAILVVIATLVGDILYTVVDPRIRFE